MLTDYSAAARRGMGVDAHGRNPSRDVRVATPVSRHGSMCKVPVPPGTKTKPSVKKTKTRSNVRNKGPVTAPKPATLAAPTPPKEPKKAKKSRVSRGRQHGKTSKTFLAVPHGTPSDKAAVKPDIAYEQRYPRMPYKLVQHHPDAFKKRSPPRKSSKPLKKRRPPLKKREPGWTPPVVVRANKLSVSLDGMPIEHMDTATFNGVLDAFVAQYGSPEGGPLPGDTTGASRHAPGCRTGGVLSRISEYRAFVTRRSGRAEASAQPSAHQEVRVSPSEESRRLPALLRALANQLEGRDRSQDENRPPDDGPGEPRVMSDVNRREPPPMTYLRLLISKFEYLLRSAYIRKSPYPSGSVAHSDFYVFCEANINDITLRDQGGKIDEDPYLCDDAFIEVLQDLSPCTVDVARELLFVQTAYDRISPELFIDNNPNPSRDFHISLIKDEWFSDVTLASPVLWSMINTVVIDWEARRRLERIRYNERSVAPWAFRMTRTVGSTPSDSINDSSSGVSSATIGPTAQSDEEQIVPPSPLPPIECVARPADLFDDAENPDNASPPSEGTTHAFCNSMHAFSDPYEEQLDVQEEDDPNRDSPFSLVNDRPALNTDSSPPASSPAPSRPQPVAPVSVAPSHATTSALSTPKSASVTASTSDVRALDSALKPYRLPGESRERYVMRTTKLVQIMNSHRLNRHIDQLQAIDPLIVEELRSLDLDSLKLYQSEYEDSPSSTITSVHHLATTPEEDDTDLLEMSDVPIDPQDRVPVPTSVPSESKPETLAPIASDPGTDPVLSSDPPDDDPSDSSSSVSSKDEWECSSDDSSVDLPRSSHRSVASRSSHSASVRDSPAIAKAVFMSLKRNQTELQFVYHAEPNRRMETFLSTHYKLVTYIDMVPELRDCISDFQALKSPATTEANHALSVVIRAIIDNRFRQTLDQFGELTDNHHNGIELYRHLVKICVRFDTMTRERLSLAFRQLTIKPQASVTQFNHSFNAAYTQLKATGEKWTHTALVDRYLHALRTHDVTVIDIKRTEYLSIRRRETNRGRTETKLNLAVLLLEFSEEYDLQVDTKRLTKSKSDQSAQQIAPRRPKTDPTRASANSVSHSTSKSTSHRQRKPPPNESCHGCKKTDHILSDCPHKTKEEKRAIYERIKQERSGSGSSSAPPSSLKKKPFKPKKKSANSVRFGEPIEAEASNPRPTGASSAALIEAHANHITCDYFASAVQSRRPTPLEEADELIKPRTKDQVRILNYAADEILLDSGASHHMTGDPDALTNLEAHIGHVTLPDGSTVESPMRGILTMMLVDLRTGQSYKVPLKNTLYVPGLRQSLWSVGAYSKEGHSVVFEDNHVFVTIAYKDQDGRPKTDGIKLLHPFLSKKSYLKPMHPDKLAHASHITQASCFAMDSLSDRRPPDQRRNRPVKLIDVDLLHRRLGHVATGSLLAASKDDMWADTRAKMTPEPFCHGCQLGMIRTAPRTQRPVAPRNLDPGTAFFVDIVDNPEDRGLTPETHFSKYLILTCALSKYTVLVGLRSMSTEHIIAAFNYFCTHHGPHVGFTVHDLVWIHPDAGSQFEPSQTFLKWCSDHGIRCEAAAPHHQHQNGMVERRWQHLRGLANKMMTHARLPRKYFGHALQYAWMVSNLTPVKDVFYTDIDGLHNPCTPYERYFGSAPNLSRFRVFGCPVVFKLYRRTASESGPRGARRRVLTSSNLIQRGGRGIFVGFPTHQAGWLLHVPSSDRLITSCDVSFDEDFHSTLALDNRLFLDAEATRPDMISKSNPRPLNPLAAASSEVAHAGPPPIAIPVVADTTSPWTPYTALPPADFVDTQIQPPFVDVYDLSTREHAVTMNPGPLYTSFVPDSTSTADLETEEGCEPVTDSSPSDPIDLTFSDTDMDTDDDASVPMDDFFDPPVNPDRPTTPAYDDDPVPYSPTSPCYTPTPDPDDTSMADAEDTDEVNIFEAIKRAPLLPILDSDECQAFEDDPASGVLLQPQPSETPRPKRMRERSTAHLDPVPLRRSKRIRSRPQRHYHHASHHPTVQAIEAVMGLDPKDAAALVVAHVASMHVSPPQTEEGSDEYDPSGTSPALFLPEPISVGQILKHTNGLVRSGWLKAFTKEIRGLVRKGTFIQGMMPKGTRVYKLKIVFKCKLDINGAIDKLKARAVFRGDLYKPTVEIDPWNPHATYTNLRTFLALCALLGLDLSQVDFVMAYLQTKMRGEEVWVQLPESWRDALPEDLHYLCAQPTRLGKALYGYTYSGKYLYEDQAEFLTSIGFTRLDAAPAIWVLHDKKTNRPKLLVLQYSDDWLVGAIDTQARDWFRTLLAERFDVEWNDKAQWYLQARIEQYPNGDITLDQYRYSRSIVERYLPTFANDEVTDRDLEKYRSPLPAGFKWSADDCSTSQAQVRQLERDFGFRYIEAVGSLNYLSGTAIEELYATRKACKYMRFPGRRHFRAVLHLLHHLRCHPPKALRYYAAPQTSPVSRLIVDAGHSEVDPMFVTFSDSSFADCDDLFSTGAYITMLAGGPVSFSSFVPTILAMSTAEAEMNAMTSATVATIEIRRILSQVLFNDSQRPWTVPLFTDSKAAAAIAKSDKVNARNRHIERRQLCPRYAQQQGHIRILHIDGDKYQLADLGTKNTDSTDPTVAAKLEVIEAPCPDTRKQPRRLLLKSHGPDGSRASDHAEEG